MYRLTILATIIVFVSLNLYSQLSISSNNWKGEPSKDSIGLVDPQSINAVISSDYFLGTNKKWNLNLNLTNMFYDNLSQPSNQTFADASYYLDSLFDPLAFNRGVYRRDYYKKTNEGLYVQGYEYIRQGYYIGDLTSGPNDSITISNYSTKYAQAFQLYKFPISSGYSNQASYVRDMATSITIAAYLLNGAPATKRSYVTLQDTVVGWGQMKITAAGFESQDKNVLVLKRKIRLQDSIFLYGQPAPAAFMNAFALVQGAVTEIYRYIVLTENLNSPMLVVSCSDANMNNATSANLNLSVLTTISGLDENINSSEINVYPNPSSDFINFKLLDNEKPSSVKIVNSLGSTVIELNQDQISSGLNRIDISSLESGVYLIKIGNKVSKFIKY